jgi:hypothetical protein
VAQRAIGGEAYSNVIGIRGRDEIRLMAAIAGRRQSGEVIIRVALRAGNRRMRAGQRKRSVVVIER